MFKTALYLTSLLSNCKINAVTKDADSVMYWTCSAEPNSVGVYIYVCASVTVCEQIDAFYSIYIHQLLDVVLLSVWYTECTNTYQSYYIVQSASACIK